jgi:transposase
VQTARPHDAQPFHQLQSVPGIGKILSLVLLYESHDLTRFRRVQDFVSYCRLVKCAQEPVVTHFEIRFRYGRHFTGILM